MAGLGDTSTPNVHTSFTAFSYTLLCETEKEAGGGDYVLKSQRDLDIRRGDGKGGKTISWHLSSSNPT